MTSKTTSLLATMLMLLLALMAFAGNSLLNRAALNGSGAIDWASFTIIRIISGALFLWFIMASKDRHFTKALPRKGSFISGFALFIYAATFSYAYITLGAGIGALILFASVQFTLQAITIFKGNMPSWLEATGLLIAVGGLIIFISPSGGITMLNSFAWQGYALMISAGVAWGIYSWIGRSAQKPALATARNFIAAAPLCLLLMPFTAADISTYGIILALASGIITSGLGYVIWYAVLPKISVSLAATAQLSVPAIATIGGILFLDEAITKTFLLGSGLIFTGIGLTIWSNRPNKGKT